MSARAALLLAAATVSLASCGGGSSGSPAPSSGTAPAPAPSPAPAPAPSPSPTPAASYPAVYDFTADFRYALIAASIERVGTIAGGKFVQSNEGRMLDGRAVNKFVAWNKATSIISFDYAGQIASFGPTNLTDDVPGGRQWRLLEYTPYRVDALTVTARVPAGSDSATIAQSAVIEVRQRLEYDMTDGTGRRAKFDRFGIGGYPTIASDLPKSGAARYRLSLVTTPSVEGAGSLIVAQDATFDFSATTMTINVVADQGNGHPKLTLNLRGTYDPATGRFEGTVGSTDSDYAGAFSGGMFGPQARQIGLVFVISSPTRQSVIGNLTGVRY